MPCQETAQQAAPLQMPNLKRRGKRRFGILYPIAIDNSFTVWDSYKTRYWPTLLLIDKGGVVRYAHVGEGAYDLTEQTIVRLLVE